MNVNYLLKAAAIIFSVFATQLMTNRLRLTQNCTHLKSALIWMIQIFSICNLLGVFVSFDGFVWYKLFFIRFALFFFSIIPFGSIYIIEYFGLLNKKNSMLEKTFEISSAWILLFSPINIIVCAYFMYYIKFTYDILLWIFFSGLISWAIISQTTLKLQFMKLNSIYKKFLICASQMVFLMPLLFLFHSSFYFLYLTLFMHSSIFVNLNDTIVVFSITILPLCSLFVISYLTVYFGLYFDFLKKEYSKMDKAYVLFLCYQISLLTFVAVIFFIMLLLLFIVSRNAFNPPLN